MKNFEIFEKIINGDLRPHKYKSNGKLLQEKIQKLEISDEDHANYWKYLDRLKNRIEVLDEDADFYLVTDLLVTDIQNEEFEELMDIEMPQPPDIKGRAYLDIIEFEYRRNVILIDEYFNSNAENFFRKYAALNIQNLRIMWDEIRCYKKLVIKGKKLDYQKSNDYVIFLLEVFLERIIYYLLELFSPYIENVLAKETMVFLSSERVEETKKLEKARLHIMAKKYKEKTGTSLPWSVSTFELEREQISSLPNINERLVIYKDYLTFWKSTILTDPLLGTDNDISKSIIPLIGNEIENLEYKLKLSPDSEGKLLEEPDNKKNLQQNDTQNEMKVLKRFKRGELKKKCQQYAIEFDLKKDEMLTKEKIMKICKSLEEEDYDVNQGSVASVLRDKLGYKKRKY